MFQSINNSRLNNLLLASFGIFGFSALIFQVVFAKNLILLFGLTAPAIATVLAVYFSGLALGSFIFGRLADKLEDRVHKIYFLFFLLIGAYGFVTPLLFGLLNILIKTVNNFYPLSFSGFNFFAFFFAFILLIFPAILIGGGFPVINKILIRKKEGLGRKVSLIYFIETFGSVLGAAAAGFWLIPSLGNNATIFFAAALNVIIAGFLFYFFRSHKLSGANEVSSTKETNEANKAIANPIFLYALFFTGFLALALEVIYTRTLILFIGSSTYAFSIILITFLLGIALGGFAASWFIDRIRQGYAYFGFFLSFIGFWLFLTLKFFERLPFWYLGIFKSLGSLDFSAVIFTQLSLTFLVIFPATFLMGVIFVLGVKLSRPALGKLGQGIGKLYFANTLGGVLGALAAGFLFIPVVGYQKSFLLILLSYFILGGFFVLREKGLHGAIKGVLLSFLIFWGFFGIFSPSWAKEIMYLGVFPYTLSYLGVDENIIIEEAEKGKILFYNEGLSNVAVVESSIGNTILRVDGKTDASNSPGDLEPEILIGALPMLFHPEPNEVLVIGLGSGITLGTITQFDEAENIDVVEIDPAVIKAADYFKKDNHDALGDSRVNTILGDARNYLYLTDKKYDVISSEPSNLWVAGNAYLFTQEFYELAKSRLKEGGVVLQWLHSYDLEDEDLKSALKTFQSAFPQAYVFDSSSGGDLFLLGSVAQEPILNFAALEKKFNNTKIKAELGRVYIDDSYELLAYLAAGGSELADYSGEAPMHRDDRPFLEFSSPKLLFELNSSLAESLILREGLTPGELVVGGDEGEISRYRDFREKLITAQIAIQKGRIIEGIETYREAIGGGIRNNFFEYNLSFIVYSAIAKLQQAERGEDARALWESVSFLENNPISK